jgi:hypothetical protein
MADDSQRKAQEALDTTITTLVELLDLVDEDAQVRIKAAIARLRATSGELGHGVTG